MDIFFFDSSEFKKDEEIYLKITADKFNEDYLLYQFFDDNSMSNSDLDTSKKVTFSKTDNKNNHKEITSVTKYFILP